MKVKVGLLKSSRPDHIRLLFRTWFPEVELIAVGDTSALSGVDVLLAGGGPDIDPSLYGEADQHCGVFYPKRDAREFAILHEALGRGLPFLGLCRGAQLLNVVLGGTLYQDLPSQRGAGHSERHLAHFSGSGLQHLGPNAEVNSTHHQGIKSLAPSLTLIGEAPDGLPEAWHRPGALGVQFHPEWLVHEDARWLTLFRWWLAGAA